MKSGRGRRRPFLRSLKGTSRACLLSFRRCCDSAIAPDSRQFHFLIASLRLGSHSGLAVLVARGGTGISCHGMSTPSSFRPSKYSSSRDSSTCRSFLFCISSSANPGSAICSGKPLSRNFLASSFCPDMLVGLASSHPCQIGQTQVCLVVILEGCFPGRIPSNGLFQKCLG
jgi:hypothetical protein